MKYRRIIWEHLKWGIYKLTLLEANTEEYLDMQENTILNHISTQYEEYTKKNLSANR